MEVGISSGWRRGDGVGWRAPEYRFYPGTPATPATAKLATPAPLAGDTSDRDTSDTSAPSGKHATYRL
jgi:hypothetical protein